jgi:hypothetical protein
VIDEDDKFTIGVQPRDNNVYCGEPKIVDISRKRFEAHPSAKPVCNPGNTKLSMLSTAANSTRLASTARAANTALN